MSTEITSEFVWHSIPPRPRDSHKGSFGTVLAVAGSAYYRGAALLAAEGALRTGAGIVTLASVEPVLAAAVARLPECCLCPCVAGAEGGISPENIPQLQRQKATVLLLGPGLGGTAQSTGRAAETRTLVQKLLPGFAGSAVLDADGLNAAAQLLAEGKTLPHPAGELIVTPRPGEMARLTGLSVAQINADRENTACQYAEKWNAVVVLKGCRTVVAAPDGRVCTNPTGNPGLARGGSGDVLAGMTAALLACGLPAYEAAACAVYLHGAAADRAAAALGEYGMLPHDILSQLGRIFAEKKKKKEKGCLSVCRRDTPFNIASHRQHFGPLFLGCRDAKLHVLLAAAVLAYAGAAHLTARLCRLTGCHIGGNAQSASGQCRR